MDKPKKQLDEAALKRLAENRRKGLETRAMKAALKKKEQADQKERLKQDYETKVLGKTEPTPPTKKAPVKTHAPIEETDQEIYQSPQQEYHSDCESVTSPPKSKGKPRASYQPSPPNYKQEYYRLKLETMQRQHEQKMYEEQYSRQPPHQHMNYIARNAIIGNIDKAVKERVFKELFGA